MVPDHSLLIAFDARLAALDDAAWERIAVRCAKLDQRGLDGALGRVELFARSIMPDISSYTHPGARPAAAAIGTAFGMLTEVVHLLGGPGPERYEREAARLRERATDPEKAGAAALLSMLGRAARQRPRHPGLAAALQAVSFMLLSHRDDAGDGGQAYAPFEPEIPFTSLRPATAEVT